MNPLPPYNFKAVQQTGWFCLHCPQQRLTEHEINAHVVATHGEPVGTNGVDYCSGAQLLLKHIRYQEWMEQEAARLARYLAQPGFGADDFLLECENDHA